MSSVYLDTEKVTFKFNFIQGPGHDMPTMYFDGGDPIYNEAPLQTLLVGGEDTFKNFLTKTKAQKLEKTFMRRGTWMHPDAKIVLGIGNYLSTFKFKQCVEMEDGVGGIFQGPTWSVKSPWYMKQVLLRAFPSKQPPPLIVNITGGMIYGKAQRSHCANFAPECKVSVEGSIAGAMPWSRSYHSATLLGQVMAAYRRHVTKTMKSNGQASGEVQFLIGDEVVGDTKRRGQCCRRCGQSVSVLHNRVQSVLVLARWHHRHQRFHLRLQ